MTSTRASTLQKETGFVDDGKVINDPIHGPMYFPRPIITIVDTPQFQRLRDVKQLGGTSYVYPGGVHTRFEHSLGVCHLTGCFLKFLKERNPHIAHVLTEKKILCLEIAALCHDLGHGPLSRVYQDQFLRGLKNIEWDHNEASVQLLCIVIEQRAVKEKLQEYEIDENDVEFIKAAMRGRIPEEDRINRFLYEIVKNRRNGIDCNMFDTILRDCYHVGVKSSFNYKRIMENFKICTVKDENRLCLRFKEQLSVRELFYSSWQLQSLVYTHKTTRAFEMMMAEAMDKADDFFQISEARNEPAKLSELSDSILHDIIKVEANGNDNLAAAKDILSRIHERKPYQFCGQTSLLPIEETADVSGGLGQSPSEDSGVESSPATEDQRKRSRFEGHGISARKKERQEHRDLCRKVVQQIVQWPKLKMEITEDDIFVEIISIMYGNGKNDPLEDIDFINKEGTLVERSPVAKSKGSLHFLKSFKDEYIRVYARDADDHEKKKEIRNRFYKWCLTHSYDVPKDMEKVPIEHDCSTMSAPKAARQLRFTQPEEQDYEMGEID